MIFICSPFKGNIEQNTEQARKYCRKVIDMGKIPIAPHLYFPQFLDDNDSIDRENGIKAGLKLMDNCSEVWVFGDIVSTGMCQEINYANKKGKVVKYVGR